MHGGGDALLQKLSEEQRAAALASEGPVLILAGAGSGKTRVITYRIAHIVATGKATPEQILALTFTNKAAREMRERVEDLLFGLPGYEAPPHAGRWSTGASGLWVTTFHSFGARILRRHAVELGYDASFVIYDSDDQHRIVRKLFAEANIDDERLSPSKFLAWMDSPKGEEVAMGTAGEPESYMDRKFHELGVKYRDHLKKHNAMDFRDLLLKPLELFTRFPEVRAHYQEQFRYVLVDEYQDTNRVQYLLTRILCAKHGNVCAVGDEDQSIYSWRGADIRNILDFEKDYSQGMRIFHLVENYRSPETVLEAANSVIVNNQLTHRKDKGLTPMKKGGKHIGCFIARDGEEEAMFVCRQVTALKSRGVPLSDIAIFYRTHAQSRLIEQRFARERVPYRIYGGTPFFSKKEIKDLLAYFWVIANPRDVVSLERAVSTPKRGVGDTSLDKCMKAAESHGVTFYEALEQGLGLPPATRKKLDGFFDLLHNMRNLADQGALLPLAELLVEGIHYRDYLTAEAREDREELVDEFLSMLAEFDQARAGVVDKDGATPLVRFLEAVSLQNATDDHSGRRDQLTLMTVHNAKGLEFPYVFLTGMEENLFPHVSSKDDPNQMEEERRLFYVGVTRTQVELVITCAKQRMIRGRTEFQVPSRFLGEIDPKTMQMIGGRAPTPFRPPAGAPQRRNTIDPIYEDD